MNRKYKRLQEYDIEKFKEKTVVIYGAGKDGERIGGLLKKKGIESFVYCDTRKKGSLFGKEIYRPFSIPRNCNVIIGSFQYIIEIYKNLKEMGFKDEQIFTARNLCYEAVVFDKNHSLALVPEHYRYDCSILNLNAYMNEGYIIKHIDLTITEICTLKCKACASLMPMYSSPRNCKEKIVIDELDSLLESNCYIEELCLIGGEPFVNQELMQKILIRYKDNIQIGTFTTITNGTLLPQKETLAAMKNNGRFYVVFSNYGKLSGMQEKAVSMLDDYGIESALEVQKDIDMDSSRVWIDYGKVQHYDFPYDKHQNMFLKCKDKVHCATLLNGKLFICTRIAHAVNIGLLPLDLPGNFLDLLNNPYITMSDIEKQSVVNNFLAVTEHPIACEYCNKDAGILVERAQQI